MANQVQGDIVVGLNESNCRMLMPKEIPEAKPGDMNAREQGMDAKARTEHRQTHAVPILNVINNYIDSLTDQDVLPRSARNRDGGRTSLSSQSLGGVAGLRVGRAHSAAALSEACNLIS